MAKTKTTTKAKATTKVKAKPTTTKATKPKTAAKKPAATPGALDELTRALASKAAAAKVDAILPRLKKAERRKAVQHLLAADATWATDRAIDLLREPAYDLSLDKAKWPVLLRVWERLAARLDDILIAEDHAFYALQILAAVENAEVPDAIRQPFATALLPYAQTLPASTRDAIVQLLWQHGTAEERARLETEHESAAFPVRARTLLGGDGREAYDQLVGDLQSPSRGATLLALLDHESDPRWVHQILAFARQAPAVATPVLVRMKAADELCDLAARAEFDEVSRWAVHGLAQLGDPRASRLLVDWLREPAGQVNAPMILTALGSCGDAEAIAFLESQLATAGSRRGFYDLAIAEIRERLGAA